MSSTPSIHVRLGNIRFSHLTNGKPTMLFNAYIQAGLGAAVIIPNMRVMGGRLFLPAKQIGANWFPLVYLSRAMAEAVYAAVAALSAATRPQGIILRDDPDDVIVNLIYSDGLVQKLFDPTVHA